MVLSRKDIIGTSLVAGVLAITAAKLVGSDWLILGSWRSATAVLLIFGLASCIFASSAENLQNNAWTVAASFIGGFGAFVAIAGIIYGSELLFIIFAATIILLWAITTLHHLTTQHVSAH